MDTKPLTKVDLMECQQEHSEKHHDVEKRLADIKNENSHQNEKLASIEKKLEKNAEDVREFKEKTFPKLNKKINENQANLEKQIDENHIHMKNLFKWSTAIQGIAAAVIGLVGGGFLLFRFISYAETMTKAAGQ